MPIAAGIAIGGAVLGALGSSSQRRQAKRAAEARVGQLEDVATVDRIERERNAATIRARLRVLGVDSGTLSSIQTTSSTPVRQALLDTATDIFSDPIRPSMGGEQDWIQRGLDSTDPYLREAAQALLDRRRQDETDRAARPSAGGLRSNLDSSPYGFARQSAAPPPASLSAHAPMREVAAGPGSWESFERQISMQLMSDLFLIDRNLFTESQAVRSGATANLQNPLLAGISGGLQGFSAGRGIQAWWNEEA